MFRRLIRSENLPQWLLLGLLAFSVLWRGGKSIDATWILTGVVSIMILITMWQWWHSESSQPPPRLRPAGKFPTSAKATAGRQVPSASAHIPRKLWWAVISFILWTVLSFVFSQTQNYGLDEVLRTGSLGLLFLWIIRFSQTTERRAYQNWMLQFVRVVSIVALIACAIGIIVYVFQPVNRFVGTFFDWRFHTDYWPNAWADFVLLAWPIVYYWSFRAFRLQKFSPEALAGLLLRALPLAIVLSSLWLSYSRASIIAFAGQLAVWALIYWRLKDHELPWKKVFTVAGTILIVSFALFFTVNILRSQWHEVQSVATKVTFTSSEGNSSVSERTQFWAQAFTLSFKHPVVGWGPYSFRFVQPQYQKSVLATSDHPHNIILKFAMERGWVVALLFVYIVGFVCMKGLRVEYEREKNGMHHASFGVLLLVGLAGLLAHNLVDYNLQFVGNALLFWVILGIVAGRIPFQNMRSTTQEYSRTVEAGIMGILFILAVMEGLFLVTSSLGRHAEARGEFGRALSYYESSSREIFSRDLHLSRAHLSMKIEDFDRAHSALRDYARSNESDPRYWKRRAEVTYAEGKVDQALEIYEEALRRGKYNDIGIAKGIVDTLVSQNKQFAVKERREEFDALIVEFVDAIEHNVHFVALSENVEAVIELCDIFARLYPQDAPKYQVMAARADHHAKLERDRIVSRLPGLLW